MKNFLSLLTLLLFFCAARAQHLAKDSAKNNMRPTSSEVTNANDGSARNDKSGNVSVITDDDGDKPRTSRRKQKKDRTRVINYDFADKSTIHTPTMRHLYRADWGRPVVVRVKNINRGAYRIKITAKDSVIGTSDPSGIWGKFLLPSNPSANPAAAAVQPESDAGKALEKEIEKSGKLQQSLAGQPMGPKANGAAKQLKMQIDTLNNSIGFSSEALKISPTPSQNRAYFNAVQIGGSISDSLTKKDSTIIGPRHSDTTILTTIAAPRDTNSIYKRALSERMSILMIEMKSNFKNVFDMVDIINDDVSKVNQQLFALHNRFLRSKDFKQAYCAPPDTATMSVLRQHLREMTKLYNRRILNREKIEDICRGARSAGLDSALLRGTFNIYAKAIDTLYINTRVDTLIQKMDANALTLKYLGEDRYYEYTSSPVYPFGDMINFKVQIDAIDSNLAFQPDDTRSFNIPIFTRGRFRFDFSTGIGTLFGLADREYHTDPYYLYDTTLKLNRRTDSIKISANNITQPVSPLIAAFLHAGWDLGWTVKPTFTLGASINTSTLDISTLLIGTSLMFGRNDRFVLSGGWALKKIKFINSRYEADGKTPYPAADFPNGVPVDNTVYRSGWFFALSYNLTNGINSK